MPALICFDLDDTLLDHSGAEKAAALHFAGVLGRRTAVSGEAFVKVWRAAAERHMAAFLCGEVTFQEQRRRRVREFVAAPNDLEADALFEVYLGAYRNNWRAFDDVAGCLNALGAHQLGVVSNGSQAQQLEKVQVLGVAEHFAFVLTAEDAGCAKPDPAIFRAAQGRRPAHDCLYIGDNLRVDAEAATRAGWRGVWLDRSGAGTPTALPTLTSLRALPPLLGSLR